MNGTFMVDELRRMRRKTVYEIRNSDAIGEQHYLKGRLAIIGEIITLAKSLSKAENAQRETLKKLPATREELFRACQMVLSRITYGERKEALKVLRRTLRLGEEI